MDELHARMDRWLADGDADGLVDVGCDLDDAGRVDEARRCFERAAAAGSVLAAFNLGNVLRRQGLLVEALEAFTAALRGGEEDARHQTANPARTNASR